MTRKLHIGGKVRMPGWEVINANPGPVVDHVGNAVDLSRFEDGTFSALYASHVLEHYDYACSLKPALAEWKRVLQPGGMIYISVPDMDILCKLFLSKSLTANDRFMVMRMMFGGHIDSYDYHYTGLNEEFMHFYFNQTGFENAQRVTGFGIFNDTSNLVFSGTPISLNMTAQRPQQP